MIAGLQQLLGLLLLGPLLLLLLHHVLRVYRH